MKYRISPIDPIISRDARQFGAGSPMHSMSWLSNILIAGAVRAVLWKANPEPDSRETLSALKKTTVQGIFPLLNEKIYFPRPLDIVKSANNIYQIKPCEIPDNCGVNMPLRGLLPAAPDTDEDFKPVQLNAFWERDLIIKWLKYGKNNFSLNDADTLSAPLHDERVHACIDPKTGTSKGGNLFATTGLDFVHMDGVNDSLKLEQISIDIEGGSLPEKFIAPIGGERRLAEFSLNEDDAALWDYPAELPEFINGRLRLVLASPAIFAKGWLPDWIGEETLTGKIPHTNATVKLISAVTERWQPVSGWSYERGNTGPKPMRRAVPAGSVYFFEIITGTLEAKNLWLKSICTDEQNINDGFGLVLAGQW
ncbi:MAG: type III-B CRISPR module-associated protein Cmr3 [Synergistaceae bacterium]|nr:type III-B CRISPR module-associated protein Cmr3 [Synergistaceae bacterium]